MAKWLAREFGVPSDGFHLKHEGKSLKEDLKLSDLNNLKDVTYLKVQLDRPSKQEISNTQI